MLDTAAPGPLHKSVTVPIDPESAFRLFTGGIDTWWPKETHSVGETRSVQISFDGNIDGRIYETLDDGTEHEWGVVVVWDPPRRVAFTWYPGRDDTTAQRVEVTFTATPDGTTVELVHTGWETLGDRALEIRANYVIGWDEVLGRFVDRRSISESHAAKRCRHVSKEGGTEMPSCIERTGDAVAEDADLLYL